MIKNTLIVFFTFITIISVGYAQNQKILPLTPVVPPTDHEKFYTGKHDKRRGIGLIQEIDKRMVIISDRTFYFASKVKFVSITKEILKFEDFNVNDRVLYFLDKYGNIAALCKTVPIQGPKQINQITDNSVVLNDLFFKFAKNIQFLSFKTMKPVPLSDFSPDSIVMYFLNSKNEIDHLYLYKQE